MAVRGIYQPRQKQGILGIYREGIVIMAYLSIEIQCQDCDEISGILVDKEDRNNPQECPVCAGVAKRIWSVPNVSTEKTSDTIPDAVAKGRFDDIRRQRDMKREVTEAKKAAARNPTPGNKENLKRVRAEKKKLDKKG